MTTTATPPADPPVWDPPIDAASGRAWLERVTREADALPKDKRKYRAEKVADVVRAVEAAEKQARQDRDQAATALRTIHGWSPVKVYRLIGVTRGLFARIEARNVERGLDERFSDRHTAEATATRLAGVPEELAALAEEARQVRDAAIRGLLTRGMTNVAVADLTGLTTARIAQLRPGAKA